MRGRGGSDGRLHCNIRVGYMYSYSRRTPLTAHLLRSAVPVVLWRIGSWTTTTAKRVVALRAILMILLQNGFICATGKISHGCCILIPSVSYQLCPPKMEVDLVMHRKDGLITSWFFRGLQRPTILEDSCSASIGVDTAQQMLFPSTKVAAKPGQELTLCCRFLFKAWNSWC